MKNKIEQIKIALKFCINNLDEGDAFGLVAYSNDVRMFRDEMIIKNTF